MAYKTALRYSEWPQLRHGRYFRRWLNRQATRLSTTAQAIFNALLSGYSTRQIEAFVGNPPANTALPVASGTAQVGQNLTSTNGTWTGNNIVYSYQWFRTAQPIAGATAAVYTCVAADVGLNVSCRVMATDPAGSATAMSNALGPVIA